MTKRLGLIFAFLLLSFYPAHSFDIAPDYGIPGFNQRAPGTVLLGPSNNGSNTATSNGDVAPSYKAPGFKTPIVPFVALCPSQDGSNTAVACSDSSSSSGIVGNPDLDDLGLGALNAEFLAQQGDGVRTSRTGMGLVPSKIDVSKAAWQSTTLTYNQCASHVLWLHGTPSGTPSIVCPTGMAGGWQVVNATSSIANFFPSGSGGPSTSLAANTSYILNTDGTTINQISSSATTHSCVITLANTTGPQFVSDHTNTNTSVLTVNIAPNTFAIGDTIVLRLKLSFANNAATKAVQWAYNAQSIVFSSSTWNGASSGREDYEMNIIGSASELGMLANNNFNFGTSSTLWNRLNVDTTSGTKPLTLSVGTNTAVDTTLTSISNTGNVSTATMAANPNVSVGSWVHISGMTVTAYNGDYLVTAISGSGPYNVSWAQTSPLATDNTAGLLNRNVTVEFAVMEQHKASGC